MARRNLAQWEGLWRDWCRKAYRFAYRLSGNEQDAQDMAQEAFARAFDHWDRYDGERPFEAWLFEILRNVYLDSLRRGQRRPTVGLDGFSPSEDGDGASSRAERIPDGGEEPLESLSREEEEGMIRKALAGLPEHYRAAVVLRDIEGLSYEEIGRILSCPAGTVRSRIHQGRSLIGLAFERAADKNRVIYD